MSVFNLAKRFCEWSSYKVHNRLFDDYKQSLCSRAYWLHTMYPFWSAWVFIFGREHCERAFNKHWRK